MSRFFSLAATVLILTISLERNAHAYLDPGVGSQALQMAVAGFFGALFALKMFWQKIRLRFLTQKQPAVVPAPSRRRNSSHS
jgi:hydrogenase-4 membrane subunit HyfE